ncbi:MAG: ABC transporter permease [Gemmatimonadales bacterium]|jgi:ABC-type multidrug transport system permease subunit
MGERNPLVQLTLARFREFVRQPETVFWVFAFPILLAVALGIAFRNRPPDRVRVAIQAGVGADSLAAHLAGAKALRVEVLDSAGAAARLRTGRVALVIVPGDPVVYRFDSTRTESHVARLVADDEVQRAFGRRDVRAVREVKITEKGARYIDFLLPGLLGMNLMGTGLWGVGFAVVSMRVRRLLKRLLASPMRRSHLLLSFAFARLATVALEVLALVGFGMLVFGVPFRGSVLTFAVVALTGALTFSAVGLLVASRAQTEEGVSGLMNVVMLPMYVLSGSFFSAANFPDVMQPFIKALPLTALNDALRAVMLDGTGLAALALPLAVLVAWMVVSFGVALKIFRWL